MLPGNRSQEIRIPERRGTFETTFGTLNVSETLNEESSPNKSKQYLYFLEIMIISMNSSTLKNSTPMRTAHLRDCNDPRFSLCSHLGVLGPFQFVIR